jgi:hypothetical protein
MINSTHKKWRSLRLKDERSVDYLNRMFRYGWYIVPFDMDGIEYFVLDVDTETPSRVNFKTVHQLVEAGKVPTMIVVVLQKGEQKNWQKAVYVRRNDAGYTEMGESQLPIDVWRPIITRTLEDGGMVTIYEKGRKNARRP